MGQYQLRLQCTRYSSEAKLDSLPARVILHLLLLGDHLLGVTLQHVPQLTQQLLLNNLLCNLSFQSHEESEYLVAEVLLEVAYLGEVAAGAAVAAAEAGGERGRGTGVIILRRASASPLNADRGRARRTLQEWIIDTLRFQFFQIQQNLQTEDSQVQ